MTNLSERLDNLQAALDLANEELATLRDALSATGPKRAAQSRKTKTTLGAIVPATLCRDHHKNTPTGTHKSSQQYSTPVTQMIWTVLREDPSAMMGNDEILQRIMAHYHVRPHVSTATATMVRAGLIAAFRREGSRFHLYQVKREALLRYGAQEITAAFCRKLREQSRKAQSA